MSVAGLSLMLTACTTARGDSDDKPAADGAASTSGTEQAEIPVSQARLAANVRDGAKSVEVSKVVRVRASAGTLQSVEVRIGGGGQLLEGRMSKDKKSWFATERLEPGVRYRVNAVGVDADGLPNRALSHFRTQDLTLDQQTFPSLAPLPGETVGVGMPVIVQFDVPVTDRASVERHLSVESSPRHAGSWSWLSDHEVHWRPKSYWQPGTKVTVNADINSVSAGNGVYGQKSRSATFTIGDSVVSEIDVAKHRMQVFVNGGLTRTIPISAGKDGFVTRSGTKVIMEKVRHKTMDAATIGIKKDDPEYYSLKVEYAMRVTYSGEFLHAAPWSRGSQGSSNVSHGCVGMSMENAAWLFNLSKRGDVVEVTGTNRSMEPGNGYTDWNKSFAEYRQGSALS